MTPLVTLELSLQDAETLGSNDPAVRAYIDLAIARVMRGAMLPNVEVFNADEGAYEEYGATDGREFYDGPVHGDTRGEVV